MKVFFISIFPELIDSLTKNGVIKNALEKSIIEYEILNPLDFLKGKERVDDKPYGGGPGMLMKAQPLEKSIIKAKEKSSNNTKVIYMTPQGEKFSQKKSKSFSTEENLIFICGRYEGIDQRIIDNFVDEEISIGDWRRKQSLGKTFLTRPDIFKSKLDKKDFSLLEEFLSDLGYESDRIADLIQIYKKND